MDPITMAIVGALAHLSESVIKDAYDALKAAIAHKCGINNELSRAIEAVEKKPDSAPRKEVLGEEVAASTIAQDPEILKAAAALIDKIKEVSGGGTTITQTVTGNQNIFSGSGDVTVTRNS